MYKFQTTSIYIIPIWFNNFSIFIHEIIIFLLWKDIHVSPNNVISYTYWYYFIISFFNVIFLFLLVFIWRQVSPNINIQYFYFLILSNCPFFHQYSYSCILFFCIFICNSLIKHNFCNVFIILLSIIQKCSRSYSELSFVLFKRYLLSSFNCPLNSFFG